MIAYVFWHQKLEHVRADEYEQALVDFQEMLLKADIPGYLGAVVSKIEGAHWMSYDKSGYEDWYFLSGSEVLDKLNHMAVSGDRKDPHSSASRLAVNMHAGVYHLWKSETHYSDAEWSVWFEKPPTMLYEQMYEEMCRFLPNCDGDLWRRQMVLGPTPEYCLMSPTKPALSEPFKPVLVKRKTVWDGFEA